MSLLKRSSSKAVRFHNFFEFLMYVATKQESLPESIVAGVPDLSMACLRTTATFSNVDSLNRLLRYTS